MESSRSCVSGITLNAGNAQTRSRAYVVTREAVLVVDPAVIKIDCRKMTSLRCANYAFVAWAQHTKR
jgi:hypothetical protein